MSWSSHEITLSPWSDKPRKAFVVKCPSPDGWKTREASIAEECGGKYTHRNHGYTLSARSFAKFKLKVEAVG